MESCKCCEKNKVCQHQQYCGTCSAEEGTDEDRQYYYKCVYCIFFGNTDNEEEWDSWEEAATRVSKLTVMGMEDYTCGVKLIGDPKGEFYDVYKRGYETALKLCPVPSQVVEIRKDERWTDECENYIDDVEPGVEVEEEDCEEEDCEEDKS